MLGILKLPSHMDGFLHPLGNSGVYSYVSKPKTVVDTYLKEPRELRHYCSDSDISIRRITSKDKDVKRKKKLSRIPDIGLRRVAPSPLSPDQCDISVQGVNRINSAHHKKMEGNKNIALPINQTRLDKPRIKKQQSKDMGTQISTEDVLDFIKHQEVDWIITAMVSRTLQESILDVMNEDNAMS